MMQNSPSAITAPPKKAAVIMIVGVLSHVRRKYAPVICGAVRCCGGCMAGLVPLQCSVIELAAPSSISINLL